MAGWFDQALLAVTDCIAALNEVPEPGADDPLVRLMWLLCALLVGFAAVLIVIVWPIDSDDVPETVPAPEQFSGPRDPAVLPIRPDACGGHSIIPSTVAAARSLPSGGHDA